MYGAVGMHVTRFGRGCYSRPMRSGLALAVCLLAPGLASGQAQPPAQPTPAQPAPPPASTPLPPPPGPSVVKLSRDNLFGTRVMVSVFTDDEQKGKEAAQAVFAELERVEALISEWRPTSDVSKLNQSAGKAPVAVSPETMAMLVRGKEMHKQTGGAFALTWAVLLQLWNFSAGAPPPTALPDAKKAKELVARIDDQRLVLDPDKKTAQLPAGMAVGVGGIAEGLGLERAVAVLKQKGITDALVFIGGDIAALGQKGSAPWTVGIQDPRAAGYFAVVPVRDEFISTSGDYEKFFVIDGQRYNHVLDPRTGMPAKGVRSATVIAKDAMTADAIDTALMVMEVAEGLALVEKLGAAAVIVDAKNEVHVSPGMQSRMRLVNPPTP